MKSEDKIAFWKSVPSSAKIIMFLEAAIIFFLSFWIFEEFQSNVYLQAYVGSLIGSVSFMLIIGGVTIISAAATVFYLRLLKVRKELHQVLLAEAQGLAGTTSGYLDRHMEEHLIEMIRKKNQAENLLQGEARPS